MFDQVLVLDTCALLWLTSGSDRLSEEALRQIENASMVYVSAISAWEISLKYEQKQLLLPDEPDAWFNLALEKHSLHLHPLDVSVLCMANKLLPHHRDPADRFIIATAMKVRGVIVTGDARFSDYDVKIIT
jgi:PIN domain nuclease of toxin-antitoxin system